MSSGFSPWSGSSDPHAARCGQKKKKKENVGGIDRPEQDTEKELSQSVQTQVCKEHRGMCFKVIDLPDYMPRETEHLFAEFF